ncbi:MAG: PKD domain-containing protein [Flavobacteriales bacterium]|nr:PKD domain-containing protein [Flavobacteriales bacterium]
MKEENMSNPFDKQIKESLEGFEMPYDAGAWNALEQQLPTTPSAGSGFGWKAAAIVGVAVVTVATAIYLNNNEEPLVEMTPIADVIEVEQLPMQAESVQKTNIPDQDESITVINDVDEAKDQSPISTTGTYTVDVSDSEKQEVDKSEEQPQVTESDKNTPDVFQLDNKADEKKVSEIKPLSVKFIASRVSVCAGENVSFISESSDHTANLNWEFGDGTISTDKNPSHSYVLPGNYVVQLIGNRKDDQAAHSIDVTVLPIPMPMLSASPKLEGFDAIPLYQYSTALQPNETAVWSFSDGTRISGNRAEHLYREAGTATATLTVKNEVGCITTVTESHSTEDFSNLLAPTAFTPDGNGLNETFMPSALVSMGIEFDMTIKSLRTGQIVYRTSNANEPWNGNLNNHGNKLEEGTYLWTVVLKENLVKNKVFTNTIKLDR